MTKLNDSTTADRATPTGILWFLLSLVTATVLAMGGAWASSIEKRQISQEIRITTVENQFATVVAQLQDLRERERESASKLDKLLERGR